MLNKFTVYYQIILYVFAVPEYNIKICGDCEVKTLCQKENVSFVRETVKQTEISEKVFAEPPTISE